MQPLFVSLFVLNIVLTIADAALAFRNSPLYAAAFQPDPEGREKTEKDIRFLLPWLVALYSALNCYAYSFHDLFYIGGMTSLLVFDLVVQKYLARRLCGAQG